ncbi:PH domain-like protein [Raphanus sativus]|nr:PH domain-like protein [Raphanus sativus]
MIWFHLVLRGGKRGEAESFKSVDLLDLARRSGVDGSGGALKRSPFLVPMMSGIVDSSIKRGMHIEALEMVYTFGMEDRFSASSILTSFLRMSKESFERAKRKAQAPMAFKKANEKQLAALLALFVWSPHLPAAAAASMFSLDAYASGALSISNLSQVRSPSLSNSRPSLHLARSRALHLQPLSSSLSISNASQARSSSSSPTHLKLALHLSTLSPSSFVSSLTPSPELSLSISNPGSPPLDPLSIKLRYNYHGDSIACLYYAIIALKKGAYLLKYGRRGKLKFCPFRLSNDETVLIWFSGKEEKHLKLSHVSRIISGQRTPIFQRYPRPEKE